MKGYFHQRHWQSSSWTECWTVWVHRYILRTSLVLHWALLLQLISDINVSTNPRLFMCVCINFIIFLYLACPDWVDRQEKQGACILFLVWKLQKILSATHLSGLESFKIALPIQPWLGDSTFTLVLLILLWKSAYYNYQPISWLIDWINSWMIITRLTAHQSADWLFNCFTEEAKTEIQLCYTLPLSSFHGIHV